ncbi:MAG: hypothetical protein WA900_10400 [Casimicrobiaceae bacterium]
MKYILALSIPAVLLGDCAIAPLEHGNHHHDGYCQDRGYHRGAAFTGSASTRRS